MASIPAGMLSFLYNVMHDTEMNERFQYEPYGVMEFFQLNDEQRQLIGDAGKKIAVRRIEKETALAVRQEHAKKVIEEAAQQTEAAGQAAVPEEIQEAKRNAIPLFKDTVSAEEVEQIASGVFAKEKTRITKQILEEIRKELEKGFGRFW